MCLNVSRVRSADAKDSYRPHPSWARHNPLLSGEREVSEKEKKTLSQSVVSAVLDGQNLSVWYIMSPCTAGSQLTINMQFAGTCGFTNMRSYRQKWLPWRMSLFQSLFYRCQCPNTHKCFWLILLQGTIYYNFIKAVEKETDAWGVDCFFTMWFATGPMVKSDFILYVIPNIFRCSTLHLLERCTSQCLNTIFCD